jgi:HlyD family secretion protein
VKPNFISQSKPFLKPSARWRVATVVIAALLVSGVALHYTFRFRRGLPAASSTANAAKLTAVSALGHLEPEGDVIHLSAPSLSSSIGSRVAKIMVQEGDAVQSGQVVAILDNAVSLQAALEQALKGVEVAKANLAKVQAGEKTGKLEAQVATIANLKAELQGQLMAQNQTIARLRAALKNAQIEHQRYQKLFEDGAVTASQLDSKQLTLTTAQEQLNEAEVNRSKIAATFRAQITAAEATLNEISEIRPTDIQAAQAEVSQAMANVTKAKADLDLAYIRSPISGKILKIYTRSGEVVGDKGIAAIGQTTQMNVVAEVYELDIGKVKMGQSATITSNAFTDKLSGTVFQIGQQVNPQDIISTDPTANVDGRIVEVKIRLSPAASERVAALTNLQVNVVIDNK